MKNHPQLRTTALKLTSPRGLARWELANLQEIDPNMPKLFQSTERQKKLFNPGVRLAKALTPKLKESKGEKVITQSHM